MLHDYDKFEINVAIYFEILFRCVTGKANTEILVNFTASIQICIMILPNPFSCSNKLLLILIKCFCVSNGCGHDCIQQSIASPQ